MEESLLKKATEFATRKHNGQFRSGTTIPYITHALSVQKLIKNNFEKQGLDLTFAQTVGLLHDTIEDTDTTYEEIATTFSKEIADAVLSLTKNDTLSHYESLVDSLQRISLLREEVAIVKICDRIDNISCLNPKWNKEKSLDYLKDSHTVYDYLHNKNTVAEKLLKRAILNYQKMIETME